MPRPLRPDPVEELVANALRQRNIQFERQNVWQRLDFYLPTLDVYIECKQFYTARSNAQLAGHPDVILIQGMGAARAFAELITGANNASV